jgi:hypothetical protein
MDSADLQPVNLAIPQSMYWKSLKPLSRSSDRFGRWTCMTQIIQQNYLILFYAKWSPVGGFVFGQALATPHSVPRTSPHHLWWTFQDYVSWASNTITTHAHMHIRVVIHAKWTRVDLGVISALWPNWQWRSQWNFKKEGQTTWIYGVAPWKCVGICLKSKMWLSMTHFRWRCVGS